MNDYPLQEPLLEQEMRFWRTPHGVRRAYADSRCGQLHYRLCQPPLPTRIPLLCLHLSPGSGRLYAQFIAEMGKDRIAVAPDTPGFGESDPPAQPPSIGDYAAVMGELMEQLGIAQFDVMGYHTGSKIAIELAQQLPGRVRRLVLVSAPVYTEEELQVQLQSMGTPSADATPADGSHLLQRWADHVRWKDPAAPLTFVQRELSEGLMAGPTGWWGHRAAFAYQHAQELPKVPQPILLLCPQDDLRTPTLRARDLLRNGHFVELPNRAHGFLDVRTAEAVVRIREFLDAPAEDHLPRAAAKAAPARSPQTEPVPAIRLRRAFWNGPYGVLHYRIARPDHGSARPLVMFHMSPNSGRLYESTLRELGRDRIAVAPDTPGFGESEAPQAPIEIEDYAITMAKLIEALGLGQVDVMGYHTGAMTCIALAIARPDLVHRVVQISSPVFTDQEFTEFRRHYARKTIREDGTHLRDAWVSLQKHYGADVPISVLARNFADSLRGGPVAHWGHRAAFNYDLRLHLPKVHQPILIINPNDDLAVQSPRGLALMRDGRMHELPGHAHGFLETMTATFGQRLRAFLDPAIPQ